MKRLHIVVPIATADAVEAALSALLSEPWSGALCRSDGAGALPGVPPPQGDAAWCSGQWDDPVADSIATAVVQASPHAVIGLGVPIGDTDGRHELAPGEEPTTPEDIADPRESLARVRARAEIAFEALDGP